MADMDPRYIYDGRGLEGDEVIEMPAEFVGKPARSLTDKIRGAAPLLFLIGAIAYFTRKD